MNGNEQRSISDLDKRVSVLEARVETQTQTLDKLETKIDLLRTNVEGKLDSLSGTISKHLDDEGMAAKRIVWALVVLILTSGAGFVTVLLNAQ